MASVSITTRVTPISQEKRYVVRFRMGGRSFKQQHAGSFRTLKDARARRDWIMGEIAGGRIPNVKTMFGTPKDARTFSQWVELWLASLADLRETSRKHYTKRAERLLQDLGDRDPERFTWEEVQEWINGCGMKPASVKAYIAVLKMVLDYADIHPNVAKDRRIRLPRIEKEPVQVPTRAQVQTIVDNIREELRLPIRVLEQTGMRLGEIIDLRWRDVDMVNERFRIAGGKTKAARRWVTVPEREMRAIDTLVPLEDRLGERRVFPNLDPFALRRAMTRACKTGGIAHFHPHDLRHRYASLQMKRGVPVTDLAAQLGHTQTSMTLDVYSHVMVDED